MTTEITSPLTLLQALDAAERAAPLPPALRELVDHALSVRRWGVLCAASRGLRLWARILEEDRVPPSAAVAEALVKVRAAMAELRRRT